MKMKTGCPARKNANEAAGLLSVLRQAGKTLVTTNGCFDLLHAGHIQYLYDAAALGDTLAVGINSDTTTRRLKGAGRPLQPEMDRCRIIAALEMVDCAFVFEEDDPCDFIKILKPDIHVKGGDYTNDIIERDAVEEHGGVVKIVPFLKDRSTTSLVERIRGE